MRSPRAQRLLEQLERDRQWAIDLLQRLVEVESPSRHPQLLRRVQELLIDAFETIDYRVRRIPSDLTGGYLLAVPERRPRGQPVQVMIGHCDTVWPEGTLAQMPISLEAGRMTGPGVYDMKAGLIQMLYALRSLKSIGQQAKVTPVVFVNSDEEVGSDESHRIVRRLARVADRVLVLEPAFGPRGKLKTARKGVAQYQIKICGKAAHAGLEPSKGVSAILELSLIVQQLFALNDPENGLSVNVGTIDGGLRSNVVAPESTATVDVRVISLEQARQFDAAIHALEPQNPEAVLEVTGGFKLPPMERTPRNLKLWDVAQEAAAELGIHVEDGLAGGGSDGNIASGFAPTLDGLGPRGDGAHAVHEHIIVDSLVERAALLGLILLAPPIRWPQESTAVGGREIETLGSS